MWAYPESMIVRVLGTAGIDARSGQSPVRLERKAREVLSILTVRAPAAVTLDELADLLWDDPPPSTVKTLRAHLSRIRAALAVAPGGADVERVGRAGYRLMIEPDATDVGLVATARTRARRLLGDGRPDSAAEVLAEARALWRGDPELPDTTAAAALSHGWRRERRLLIQEHLACVVAGTDPVSAIGELEQLTAADPLDEPLWAQYIRALYRGGRQTEAVKAASAARAALVEVGLEPTKVLRDAEAVAFGRPPGPALATVDSPAEGLIAGPIRYATGDDGATAFICLSGRGHDLVVLNPAMLTIDGLLDDPRPRAALGRFADHARVVCLDRRGIGLSDPLDLERPPLDQWVTDVRQVLDTLGIARTDLFANFDTGLIAIEFAARHPERVRSLILTQCYPTYLRTEAYPYGFDEATTEALIRDSVTPSEPARSLDTVAYAAPSIAGDDRFRRWWNHIGHRAASPATAAAIRTVATRTDLRHRLAAVAAPTLVLHRRSCLNVDIGHAHYLASNLPDARLHIVGGTDSLWFTDTSELVDRVVDFITHRPPVRWPRGGSGD